jgi:hypothetical protein
VPGSTADELTGDRRGLRAESPQDVSFMKCFSAMQINAYVLGRTENANRAWVLQNKGKRPRERPRRRWDYNVLSRS